MRGTAKRKSDNYSLYLENLIIHIFVVVNHYMRVGFPLILRQSGREWGRHRERNINGLQVPQSERRIEPAIEVYVCDQNQIPDPSVYRAMLQPLSYTG